MTDIKQVITDKIIKALAEGVSPWRCPFEKATLPINFKTDHKYRGANTLMLWLTAMFSGYTSNYWIGFQQARSLNAYVRKKETGTPIIVCKPYKKTVINRTTQEEEEVNRKFFKAEYVFNIDQVEGLKIITENPDIKPIEKIETLITQTGVIIRHQGERAYYSVTDDFINMPYKSKFKNMEDYYSTLTHEFVHWTGAESRLNRFNLNNKEDKALEELIAEIGSAFLCAEYGLTQNLNNSASYIDSWLENLKKDTNYIFKASKFASEAVKFIQNSQVNQLQIA